MKRPVLLLIIGCFVMCLMLGCNSYGTKLVFNGGELYYTKNVTETEANKLGDFLVGSGYFTGDKKSVQLDKSGETYQVRMAVKEGIDKDEKFLALYPVYAAAISKNVFNGAQVEIHLTDAQLKTLKVVPMKG
jgi:hypothetical protein